MKATDLMIGDWVLLDKNAWIDDEYDRRCGVPDYQPHKIESGEDLDESVNADGGALPIPLTQEILEKNGFEKKEDDFGQELYSLLLGEWVITYMSIYGCPYLTIEDVLDYDRGHSVLILKDSVYNVHELQHALKVCKIEKEIVL